MRLLSDDFNFLDLPSLTAVAGNDTITSSLWFDVVRSLTRATVPPTSVSARPPSSIAVSAAETIFVGRLLVLMLQLANGEQLPRVGALAGPVLSA